MAIKKESWNAAFDILSKFERKIISPTLFTIKYFTDETGISKTTLWRHKKFHREFKRIEILVDGYLKKNKDYDLEKSLVSKKDQLIDELRTRIKELEQELDYERERLAYASCIARKHNIDPIMFEKETPLLTAIHNKAKMDNLKKKNVLDLDRFRK